MSKADQDAPLFFRTSGREDLPPLVLIHGLYGDSSTMTPIAERLSDRFRVITIDALGHGRSPRPDAFTLLDQGKAVNELLAFLGYESATIAGVSMGSYIAAQAAILEPARTAHLVLVVTKGSGTTSSTAAYAARHGFDLAAASLDEALAFMAGAMWSPETTEDRRAALFAQQTAQQIELDASERAAIDRSLQGFDLEPALGAITARTLVIAGRSDGLNPPEVGEQVASLIPDARFTVYEHSGHMLAYEEMDRLVLDITTTALDVSQEATGSGQPVSAPGTPRGS